MSDLNRRLGSSHLMTRANTVEKNLQSVLYSRIHGYHKSEVTVVCLSYAVPLSQEFSKRGLRTHLMNRALPKQLCFKFYVFDNCTLLKNYIKLLKS